MAVTSIAMHEGIERGASRFRFPRLYRVREREAAAESKDRPNAKTQDSQGASLSCLGQVIRGAERLSVVRAQKFNYRARAHKGLTKALEKWPGCRLQRCTEHKRANLLEHCPAHARRELRRDYNRIVYAKNGIDARKAYDELVAKWTPLAPAVVRSLEEAGNQLLTFYEFPRAMWKSIRTTNALENLNREFRRRTKTQASFSSEESAVALLFGLIASGQIQLRRIDGYQRLSEVLEHAEVAA